MEVSGPPCNPDHAHYVGDRNKIAKNLKSILNFIRIKHSGDFEDFRKIKVVGVQIYENVFYVYSLSMPFAGIYYFKLEMTFDSPTITFTLFKVLPKFLSKLWTVRDIILSSAESVTCYVSGTAESSGDNEELDPVTISPKKRKKIVQRLSG